MPSSPSQPLAAGVGRAGPVAGQNRGGRLGIDPSPGSSLCCLCLYLVSFPSNSPSSGFPLLQLVTPAQGTGAGWAPFQPHAPQWATAPALRGPGVCPRLRNAFRGVGVGPGVLPSLSDLAPCPPSPSAQRHPTGSSVKDRPARGGMRGSRPGPSCWSIRESPHVYLGPVATPFLNTCLPYNPLFSWVVCSWQRPVCVS